MTFRSFTFKREASWLLVLGLIGPVLALFALILQALSRWLSAS